jgi:phosphatidylinositol 4-kinase B
MSSSSPIIGPRKDNDVRSGLSLKVSSSASSLREHNGEDEEKEREREKDKEKQQQKELKAITTYETNKEAEHGDQLLDKKGHLRHRTDGSTGMVGSPGGRTKMSGSSNEITATGNSVQNGGGFYMNSLRNILGYGGGESGRAYAPAPESWLLRFFKSEFFDCWIAVSYLFKYKTIGIQDYICRLMRNFPIEQVQFFLPQLCQLVVFRPDCDSTSLEFFILETCHRSTHFAILTLWHLEALVTDFQDPAAAATLKKYPQPYLLCRKILGKCQSIVISGDLTHMYDEEEIRVNSNAKFASIGIGYTMASVAAPDVVDQMKDLLLNHSRRKVPMTMEAIRGDSMELVHSDSPLIEDIVIVQPRMPRKPPSAEELHHGKAFSLSNFLTKHHASSDRSTMLQQQYHHSNVRASRVVNQHFVYSQIQFILALMDIGNRLLTLPREARSSSLRAEVSLLNHNLPARVCIPFWCPATADRPFHHYIVRIPPEDAVVLNSKDRVPYLVLVEVLEVDEHHSFGDLLSHKNPPPKPSNDNGNPAKASEVTRKPTGSSMVMPKSKPIRLGSKSYLDPHHMDASSADSGASSRLIHDPQTVNATRIEESRKRIESFASALRESELQRHGILKAASPQESSSLSDRSKHRPVGEDISECMKTASVMLAQLSLQDATAPSSKDVTMLIRNRIIQELMILEERRMAYGFARESDSAQNVLDPEAEKILSQEDPSASVFKEVWDVKVRRIKSSSPYGHLPNWKLFSIIVKTGADLRQEQFACQLISEMQRVWKQADLPIRAYW